MSLPAVQPQKTATVDRIPVEVEEAPHQPFVPASPTPLAPSGFKGVGVTVWSSTMSGISPARGTA